MKRYFIYGAILTIAFAGCSKKSDSDISAQDAGGTVPTEFTLMQDTLPKAATGESVQSRQPEAIAAAPAVSMDPAALPVVSEPTTKDIQQALKNANLYSGKIDGDLGPKTKKAIKDFQEQNGLKADGKVGAKTWAKLSPFLNQAAQSEPTLAQD